MWLEESLSRINVCKKVALMMLCDLQPRPHYAAPRSNMTSMASSALRVLSNLFSLSEYSLSSQPLKEPFCDVKWIEVV